MVILAGRNQLSLLAVLLTVLLIGGCFGDHASCPADSVGCPANHAGSSADQPGNCLIGLCINARYSADSVLAVRPKMLIFIVNTLAVLQDMQSVYMKLNRLAIVF